MNHQQGDYSFKGSKAPNNYNSIHYHLRCVKGYASIVIGCFTSLDIVIIPEDGLVSTETYCRMFDVSSRYSHLPAEYSLLVGTKNICED